MIDKRFYCDACEFEYDEQLMMEMTASLRIENDDSAKYINQNNTIDICIYCHSQLLENLKQLRNKNI
jgi:hypothetical protein